MAQFRLQISLKNPSWSVDDFPWPGRNAVPSSEAMKQDIESMNEKQQECQFKADVLALSTDCCRICRHLTDVQSSLKAKQIAQASWVRNQVHQGRLQVIEPHMENFCMVKAGESVASLAHTWGKFVGNAASVAGTCLKIFFCDCHKFGRMSDDDLTTMMDMIQQVAAPDPANFAAVLIVTTVTSKKRLQGRPSPLGFTVLVYFVFQHSLNYIQCL